MKCKHLIKQTETVETIPELSQAASATEYSKLLPAYYVLRELFKDKPYVKLQVAVKHIAHYLKVSNCTAYKYLEHNCPFWEILPKVKTKSKIVKLGPIFDVCFYFDITYASNILLTPVKNFACSIQGRKAMLYQDSICKKGSSKVIDEFGAFGRCWTKNENGKYISISNSKGEEIIKREYNYPVSRATIERRTGLPLSTQRNYDRVLIRECNGFYIIYNFLMLDEFTWVEYKSILAGDCNIELIDKIMGLTGNEGLGKKFKARRVDNNYFLLEQIPNSYQNYIIRRPKGKVRKFNQKLKKRYSKVNTDTAVLFQEKLNNFNFGPKVIDDGIYWEGAKTVKRFIKEGFWVKIVNHRRKIFSELNIKDFVFKDNNNNKSSSSNINIINTNTNTTTTHIS